MKTGSSQAGYTIVEVLIFLAVSAVLFVSSMSVIGGQQSKTEFYTSVKETTAIMQDVINDVATGYYNNSQRFTCTNGPIISASATDTQGTNAACVFIGRVFAFGVTADSSQLNIYNIVGNRQNSSGKDITTLAESVPTALAPTTTSPLIPPTIDTRVLAGGLRVGAMVYDNGSSQIRIGAAGLFSTLPQSYNGSPAGGQTTQIIPIENTNWQNQNTVSIAETIRSNSYVNPPIDPSGGIKICLISGGTRQVAILTVGGSGKLTVSSQIRQGDTCPAEGSL